MGGAEIAGRAELSPSAEFSAAMVPKRHDRLVISVVSSGADDFRTTLSVLTSGAGCAGLNAVIRAVCYLRRATPGWRVLGAHCLLRRPVDAATLVLRDSNSAMSRMAGSIHPPR